MTPEKHQDGFSTDGVRFEDSLRGVPAGGPAAAYVDRELTDEEVLEIWETTIAGVKNGSIPTFADKHALLEDVLRRLGR